MDMGFFAAFTGLSGSVVDFLMQQSLYAAAVAVVVWTVLAIVKPRHPLLHLTLWWFVLARLVLPADLATSWSLRASAETLLAKAVWPLGEPHVNVVGGQGSVPVSDLGQAASQVGAQVPAMPVEAVASTAADMLPLALFLFWVGGAVAMAILLVRAERSARNTIAMAEPAENPLLGQLVDAWAKRFGISRHVRVLVTQEATAPFTAGVLRPVIVLPRKLLDRLDAVEMSAVIGHEMSHIRSFDAAWRMVERALLVVFFFHPMVWMAVRRIDTAREAACDVSAANSGVVARNAYAKSLLAALKAFRIEPEMAFARTLSIQGGTGDGLKTRLVWLKGETAMSTPAKVLGAVGIVGLGLLVLPMAQARQSMPAIDTETLDAKTPAAAPTALPVKAPAAPHAPVARVAPSAPAVLAAPASPALQVAPAAPPAPELARLHGEDFGAAIEESIEARLEAEEAAREAELDAAEIRREAEQEAREAQLEARLAAAEARREADLMAREARREAMLAANEAHRTTIEAQRAANAARRDAQLKAAEARREAAADAEVARRKARAEVNRAQWDAHSREAWTQQVRSEAMGTAVSSLRRTAEQMRTNPDMFLDRGTVYGRSTIQTREELNQVAAELEAKANQLEREARSR